MYHRLLAFILVFASTWCVLCRYADAADRDGYKVEVSPSVSQIITKTDFNVVQDRFTISNQGDPFYLKLTILQPKGLYANVYEIADGEYKAINTQSVSLMREQSRRDFLIEIVKEPGMSVAEKEHLVDVSIQLLPIAPPLDASLQVEAHAVLHKYVLIDVTKDGSTPMRPKIALFALSGGPMTVLTASPHLVAMVQNMGEYTITVTGSINISGPGDYRDSIELRPQYVFAHNQKDVLSHWRESQGVLSSNIPLRTGVYTASLALDVVGSGTPKLYAQYSFFMVSPWVLMIFVILCLTVVVATTYIGLHHI